MIKHVLKILKDGAGIVLILLLLICLGPALFWTAVGAFWLTGWACEAIGAGWTFLIIIGAFVIGIGIKYNYDTRYYD